MAGQDGSEQKGLGPQAQRLAGLVRFYGVIYRVTLAFGLLILVAAVVVLILTDLITIKTLVLPLVLIAVGLILARVEYRLDMRLYDLQNQASKAGENSQ